MVSSGTPDEVARDPRALAAYLGASDEALAVSGAPVPGPVGASHRRSTDGPVSGRGHGRAVGDVPPDGDAVGDPEGVPVVVEGVVEGGPVVPEGHRARLPAEPAGQFGLLAVPVEHVEDGGALVGGEAEDRLGELRVHEEAPAAVLGMGAHHRVEAGKQLVVVLAVPVVAAAGLDVGGEPRVEVDGDQLVAHGPHRGGEPVVGVLEARPRGVAAHLGAGEHGEDRAERRGLEEGDVGVPPAGPVLAAVDGQDLGVALDRRAARVPLGELAELAAEGGLLVVGEFLVAEEHDVVGVEGVPDGGHGGVVERPGQVDAGDLGADDRRERADLDPLASRHGTQCGPTGRRPFHRGNRPARPVGPVWQRGRRTPEPSDPGERTVERWTRDWPPRSGTSRRGSRWSPACRPPSRRIRCPTGTSPPSIAWRGRFAARLDGALAPWPRSGAAADVEIDDGVAADGYRRHRLVFDTEDTMSVPAYLLVPDGREAPGSAVLAVHGHGPGKSRICGLEPDDAPGDDYAAELARRGHVVLAPDLRCFGERLDWNPEDHYACDTNLVHQVMAGWSPLTQNLWDCARALDVLVDHPLVDPARHGRRRVLLRRDDQPLPGRLRPAGGRRGGERVLLVVGRVAPDALEHVRVPGASGDARGRWSTPTSGPWSPPGPCSSRPAGRTCSSRWRRPSGRSARLRRVYAHLGAADRLVHEVSDGEHQWYGRGAYAFLAGHLGAGSAAE